ncbi:MAG: hypothetical protein OXD36_12450 [Rhodobacter sp.]|nr:hypothetical protein [Rhodobacter sp.]
MKKPSTSTALPALAAALAFALAGCGGGGDGTPGTGGTSPGGDTTPDTETTPEGDTTQNIRPTPGGGGGGGGGDPTVMFSSPTQEVRENGDRKITVTLSAPAPTGGLTLKYTVDGGGEETVTVDAGERTATITLTLANNTATETRTIVLVSGDGYTLGTQKEIALTILEENARVVTITRPSGGLTAGGTTSIRVYPANCGQAVFG